MFTPKTKRIKDIAKDKQEVIRRLEGIFDANTRIYIDYANETKTFVLWSGDSDFADPLEKLLKMGKKVCLFATAGRISSELNELKKSGLKIVDIFELKEFICWLRESAYKSTKDLVSEAL